MKNKFYLLLTLFSIASIAMAVPALAQKGEAAGDESETVIVPFDGTKPVETQKPDQVYIPYERFVELWEAAKASKRGIAPEKGDVSHVLSSSRYDAKLDNGALHVTGVIELQTFNDGWVSVPLDFADVKIGTLKLDGQPAPLGADGVMVEKAGHHRIEVEFEIPATDNKTEISWGIPKTAGTLFSIRLPDKQMKASISPGNGVVERINGDQKIVTAALGTTDRIDLQLDSSVGLSTITQAEVAKIDTTLNITPAVELVHSGFEFSFPESQQDHFTVLLDKALALVKLDVPNLKSWKLSVTNDKQTLEITLAAPVRDSFKFSIDAERSLADRQRHFPYISAVANRIEQTSALFSTQFLDVTTQPTEGLRQISLPGGQGPGLRPVAAYSSTGDKESLAYEVQPSKLSNKADISYVYQVNHSKIELVAALKLRIKDATLYNISVGLPGDFVVQAVESDRLKDWWRDGDMLHVRFKGNATDAVTPLVLHLVKQFKTVPDALEIRPLTLPDSWEVEGNGIIAANTSVKAAMTLTEAKEINPQNAATDFRILAPMERKRGFSFKGQNFQASVKLETLPPRVNGTWVMSAQAHENWVSVSTHVNLSARQGSAAGASFRLPASAPEARVTGGNVRETTSSVDGNWRVYHVAFQNDLTDQTDFALDFDLPGTGNVSLPAFEFLDVERVEGFVIVDNASEYEMQVKQTNLEAALNSQIPFLPQVSRNARLFSALPGWTMQIDLTRLEKEAGRSAFVEWAELTTAIREDGSEWYRASYHLQNRSLQFLPVKLPEGSELASVTVAGENVRADQGKVDGKEVLLVPLIKTKPGDASYDVDLVYRKRKTGYQWTFKHETLADPEIVGITVERTLWSLYVPEGSDAGHFGGNMEEVLAEVNETEKLEGSLAELKELNSLIFNSRSSDTTQNAGDNFRRLAKTVEEKSQVSNDRSYAAAKPEGKNAALQEQTKYISEKKAEIQKELETEKKSFEGNVLKAQQQQTAGAQQQPQPNGNAQFGGKGEANQVWMNNGGYVSKGKDADNAAKANELDRKNPEGRQLYVNDYVVNVQANNNSMAINVSGSNTYTGTTTLSGLNTYTGGTTVNAGTVALAGNNNYSGNTTINNGILVNPNASVQGQVAQLQSDQAQQRLAVAPDALKKDTSATDGQVTTGLRSGSGAVPSAPASMTINGNFSVAASSENVKVLNNARGNAIASNASSEDLQNQSEATAQLNFADAPEKRVVAQAAAPAMPGGAPAQDAADATFWSPYNTGSGNGSGGGHAKAPPAQLQAAGAISLPVDFPTEGRVYHFKKLKANAKLTLWITNQQGFDKWKWVLAFLLAAALAAVGFKFLDRGSRRDAERRVAHV